MGPALLLIAQLYRVEKQARLWRRKIGYGCANLKPGPFWTNYTSTCWRSS